MDTLNIILHGYIQEKIDKNDVRENCLKLKKYKPILISSNTNLYHIVNFQKKKKLRFYILIFEYI